MRGTSLTVDGVAARGRVAYERWRDQYGSSQDVIGRSFQVDEETYTIVGVAPAALSFPEPDTDVWLRSRTEAPEISGFPEKAPRGSRPDRAPTRVDEEPRS